MILLICLVEVSRSTLPVKCPPPLKWSRKKKSSDLENQGSESFDQTATENARSIVDRIGSNTVADLIQDLLQGASPAGAIDRRVIEDRQKEKGTGQDLEPNAQSPNSRWYLGIDVGTTGISAVLLDRVRGQLYPLYWDESQAGIAKRRFRLPAVVSLVSGETALASSPAGNQRFTLPISIATLASFSASAPSPANPFLLRGFKPALKLSIPYLSAQTQQWQPVLQWTDLEQVPLIWMQQALQTLLMTLNPAVTAPASSLSCGALGLESAELAAAIDQLSGVIVGYPFNWPDTYSFNLREAVLSAQLVDQPEQIFLIEDSIATLLSVLRQEGNQTTTRKATEPQHNAATNSPPTASRPPVQTDVILHNADWQGKTLILSAGATVTELALVNLPVQLQDLRHSDFHIYGLPFAGDAIDQDIVCHLLYPLLQEEQPISTDSNHPIDLSLATVELADLELDHFVLPVVGEPDLFNRYRLHQRLESSQSGQILLEAARSLKLAFQQQSRFTLQLGDRHLTILRQNLGSRILLPYVQRLNRELNTLLQQTSTATESINQVICTGGTASIRAIGRWLHEKFPNATIIQDTYTYAAASVDHCLPSCSRVAYGLAALPLQPQVLDKTRHQYNDYFLLLTLLRSLPQHPISVDEIVQILQQQGVDELEPDRSRLLRLLEGQLPAGLLPTQDAILLTDESLRNADFKGVQVAPLFHKLGDKYQLDPYQRSQLQRALETILSHTDQKLDRPYSYSLEIETSRS